MADEKDHYGVIWGRKARIKLATMKPYKINPTLVFRKSKSILTINPHEKAYGVVEDSSFEFNGYYWIYINNVIIVYDVLKEEKKVLIDACYFASTGIALQRFYGEHDTDPL